MLATNLQASMQMVATVIDSQLVDASIQLEGTLLDPVRDAPRDTAVVGPMIAYQFVKCTEADGDLFGTVVAIGCSHADYCGS
jgi:hypothetical protein